MNSEFRPDARASRGEDDAPNHQTKRAYAGASDPGCERENNEDRYLVTEAMVGIGYFVFDGMGGEPGGETASQLSADAIQRFFSQQATHDVEEALCASIESAQHQLLSFRSWPQMSGMGTTVVGACVARTRVAIAAVGDSRAYRVSKGGIKQLTSDHTIVQQLVDAGHLAPEDALIHPQSHVLTRCLGSEISFKVDCCSFRLCPVSPDETGDVLVLCSDGLYSMVSDHEIFQVVSRMEAPEAVKHLISLARDRGGFDNITVLIIHLEGSLEPDSGEAGEEEQRTLKEPTAGFSAQVESMVLDQSDIPKSGIGREECDSPRMVGAHLRNVVLLGALSGFAAMISFAILMMLRR